MEKEPEKTTPPITATKRYVNYTAPEGGEGRVRLGYILAVIKLPPLSGGEMCYQLHHGWEPRTGGYGVIYIDRQSYNRIKQILGED